MIYAAENGNEWSRITYTHWDDCPWVVRLAPRDIGQLISRETWRARLSNRFN